MSFRFIAASAKIVIQAIFLLSLSGFAIAENETQLVAKINGEISVNASGEVKQILLTNVNDAKLKAYLINKIKSWVFYPIQINGKPVEARTELEFDVILTYASDKSLRQFQFSNVSIKASSLEAEINKKQGFKRSGKFRISYPIFANRKGVEAKVAVAVDITADGKVKKADVTKLEIMNVDNISLAKSYSKEFAETALKGLLRWQWTKDELTRNECLNGCVGLIRVDFVLPVSTFWRWYQNVPQDPIPWVIASELKDMNESEKSQLVRLKDDPTGKPIDMGG